MAFITVRERIPVSLKDLNIATGTWTYTESTGLIYMLKTATAETSTVTYTLPIPRRSGEQGVRLISVINPVRVTTADLSSAPTINIYRNEFDLVNASADGDSVATALTTTNTAVVTNDANDRLWTTTVTSPDWDYGTEAECVYVHKLAIPCAASTVVRLYPPIVVYDLMV